MEPITLLALGAGALWLLGREKKTAVKGPVTGKTWLVSTTAQPSGALVNVYAPAGSYGPHQEALVVRYQVATPAAGGSPENRSTYINPDALPQMVTDAGKDFQIKKGS